MESLCWFLGGLQLALMKMTAFVLLCALTLLNVFVEPLWTEFGTSEPAVSNVCDVRVLLELGNSVCRLLVGNEPVGTGFVMVDNLVLTSAHLFREIGLKNVGGFLRPSSPMFAEFMFEEERRTKLTDVFQVVYVLHINVDAKMDYAVLGLALAGEHGQPVPPGLLSHFAPTPKSGGVSLIGHHAGKAKKIHITNNSSNRRAKSSVLESVRDELRRILKVEWKITYDTFMYHGSSGSPVFDSACRVVGIHTGGHPIGDGQSLVEHAIPVWDILNDFFSEFLARSGVALPPGGISDLPAGDPLRALLEEHGLLQEKMITI